MESLLEDMLASLESTKGPSWDSCNGGPVKDFQNWWVVCVYVQGSDPLFNFFHTF